MKKTLKIGFLVLLELSLATGIFYFAKTYIFTKNESTLHKKEEKKENTVKEKYPKEYKLSMIMTGDALIHTTVYKDAHLGNNEYDFTKQMDYISPIIKNYDLAYYNQETIIGGKNLGISSYPRFNTPDEFGDCMINMGFNMVSLATNHTMDKGEQGVLYSVNYWKQKENVLTAGSYDSYESRNTPIIREKNNIKYSLLSYTTVTNGLLPPNNKDYLTNIYSDDKAKEDIEKIKDKVDIIFVAMHWGEEYNKGIVSEQKRIATYLSSLGVNVIIGTHPHVLEPIEYINDTLVIYSLGNFISAQIGVEKLTGALVTLDITKTINEDKKENIKIDNLNAELIYTYYKNWKDFKVIPYKDLNETLLPNYKTYYEKYTSVLRQFDNAIPVTSLE